MLKRCSRKNWSVEKKNSWKKSGPVRFYGHFSEIFFEKKSKKKKFVEKFFFLKVVISFLNMARKKSFFLKIFPAQILAQILKMSHFAGRSNFEKNFPEIFFHSYNIAKGSI